PQSRQFIYHEGSRCTPARSGGSGCASTRTKDWWAWERRTPLRNRKKRWSDVWRRYLSGGIPSRLSDCGPTCSKALRTADGLAPKSVRSAPWILPFGILPEKHLAHPSTSCWVELRGRRFRFITRVTIA